MFNHTPPSEMQPHHSILKPMTGLLWTAPEVLRKGLGEKAEEAQKADIYSFGIICQEVIYRNGVFWVEEERLHPSGNFFTFHC